MKAIFIVDHNINKNINQVMMFVPEGFDRARARVAAQECGIESPNILAVIDVDEMAGHRMADHVDYYVPYSR